MRRRRLLFRAWRRGVRETDLIVGRFADAYIDKFDEPALDDFERLIEVPNAELYAWVVGAETVPADYDTAVLRQLIAFHQTAAEAKAIDGVQGVMAAQAPHSACQIAGRAAVARPAADARRRRRRRRRLGDRRSRPRRRRRRQNRRRSPSRSSAATARAWRRCRARSPSSRPTPRCWNSRPGIACPTTGCRRMPPWWRSA